MITRAEQIKLKQAQAGAGIQDAEYRATLEQHCAVRSSTDPKFTHEQFERMMALFEAIHWRGRAQGTLEASPIFLRAGYWAERCRNGEANRSRWVALRYSGSLHTLEEELLGTGVSVDYLDAIRARTIKDPWRPSPMDQAAYGAALARTIKSRTHNVPNPS
jgi:hypothetical protein